jgi:SpoIID/LytB domain protein
VDLESYVADTILSEVSPLGESDDVIAEIFEVQAIVARSYAVTEIGRHRSEGFDVCDSTHCQLYQPSRRQTSRFAAAALQAGAANARHCPDLRRPSRRGAIPRGLRRRDRRS